MKKIIAFYRKCRSSQTSFVILVLRAIYLKLMFGKTILLHQRVRMHGVKNITANGKLEIGTEYVGFTHKRDITYLNIRGKLKLAGPYSIGRGCRINIEKDGIVSIGQRGYINANTSLIIMHSLTIGNDCVISWNCQFLDEDFHEIRYEGRKESSPEIVLGNKVWVGCGVKIYKGTHIADGCVVAADSVVRGIFAQPNALIGGNPARVIKENISWE